MTACLVILASAALPACSSRVDGAEPMEENGALLPSCPSSPNCVSSLSDNPPRQVDPFPVLGESVSRSLDRIESIIRSMPRTAIVARNGRMVKAEFQSRLGFVDDVQFASAEGSDVIHVRSASRKGYWDLGVNRRRVERIRKRYLQ